MMSLGKRLVVLLLMVSSLVFAKNTISKETYGKLQKAQKMIEKKQYKSAQNILAGIVKGSENEMEKTYALQSLSNIYIAKKDYKEVAKYYEKIIALNTLEKKEVEKMKFSLSQIYLSESMYKKSIKYSLELLNSSVVKKSMLDENLAIAYYSDRQYKKSVPYIKKIIAIKKSKENWYRMLYSAYIEMKNYNNAISTLKFMVKNYAKEEYWMQLISIYQTTKKYKKSLATLELAYKKGFVNKSKNLMYLVSILHQNELYNKAAHILQTGLDKNIIEKSKKNLDILISSYLNAKNYKKAIPLLKNSNSPKYQILLANIYYNKGEYKSSVNVLKEYSFKKGSKYDGQKYIMMALSEHELDNKINSKKYLKKASINTYEKKRAYTIAKGLGYKI